LVTHIHRLTETTNIIRMCTNFRLQILQTCVLSRGSTMKAPMEQFNYAATVYYNEQRTKIDDKLQKQRGNEVEE